RVPPATVVARIPNGGGGRGQGADRRGEATSSGTPLRLRMGRHQRSTASRRLVDFRAANRFLRRELANARMKPPRPTGARLVSDETSKPLPIWRGTEGSNPFPSCTES